MSLCGYTTQEIRLREPLIIPLFFFFSFFAFLILSLLHCAEEGIHQSTPLWPSRARLQSFRFHGFIIFPS
ncbi:hypothetical protein I7I52_08635 [Histoplasma capsulatum]|uniref:Uncharacterized protein n=1 Tax=Ajellomyces capsulatus TaxID=5037 RepID=A0A8H7YJX4_AJECA|nr:hypothetical protein I7I52_08635 [Histoplasma capsulatum]